MVTLALAKEHLEYDGSDRDALIQQYIDAAQAYVEGYTSKGLSVAARTQSFDSFQTPLVLDVLPVASVTSVAYLDSDGASQAVTGPRLVAGEVYPALNESWPAVGAPAGILVTYQAGLASVPADLVSAQLLLIGHYFSSREAASERPAQEIALAVEALCRPHRALRL